MNKTATLKLLRNRYQSLDEVGPNLVRAERQHRGAIFAVFYFDFSESVAKPEFSLSAFVQEHLASDFYRNEGSLQWNYYIYFVLDSTTLHAMDAPQISAIEADRTFARKYVRDEESLNRELSTPLSTSFHSSIPTQDIASRWVKRLTDAGLGGITNPRSDYAPIIRSYLKKDPSVPQKEHDVSSPVKVESGRFIKTLELTGYRKFPLQRTFDFGRINLIRGVNGTGKTSLLDAIELCICGANRRQRSTTPANAKIKIQFAGQERSQICPSRTTKDYRDRDRSWYGGYYLQGNRLCENFARFNFFDTDAAAQLSSDQSSQDIQAAVNTLFLGEFANSVEERMRQCSERFNRELQSTQRDLKGQRTAHRKFVDDLVKIRAVKDTREALNEELQSKAKDCKWKKLPSRLTLETMEALQQTAAYEMDLFAQTLQRVGWLPRLTISALQREIDRLTKASDESTAILKALQSNSVDKKKNDERAKVLAAAQEIIDKIDRYHDEPGAFDLLGISRKKALLEVTLGKWEAALSFTNGINFKPFATLTTPLGKLVESYEKRKNKKSEGINDLKRRHTGFQTQFSKIKAITSQIRSLGKHFCEISPEADLCPLCGGNYADLSAQIASLELPAELESPLGELSAQIAREESELIDINAAASNLSRLNVAARSFLDMKRDQPTNTILKNLADLPNLITSKRTELDAIVTHERLLAGAGFTEAKLKDLLNVATLERELPFEILIEPKLLHELRADTMTVLESARKTAREHSQFEKKNTAKLARIYDLALSGFSTSSPDIEISRRVFSLKSVLSTTRSQKRAIELGENDDFSNLASVLKSFTNYVAQIYEAVKRIEEKDTLEKSLTSAIAEADQTIGMLEPREGRIKEAISLLDDLLGGSYKDSYLQDMQAKHHGKLVTLFSRIHAPHEFTDIEFGEEVRLKRESGALDPVRRISTGQRAALAVSIFLSMNSSVSHHAPWLLFDDPIVHVDDLNILSFLDVLRDLVLLGDRQVFFATANPRVADLFLRKFECLGDEFREFHLRR